MNRYHCAYCGKLLPKESLVIDHLIPVQRAKSSVFWQRVLKVTGIKNVNNPKNLVGTCVRCNSRKGSKTSFWILRGIIGRSYSAWLCIKCVLLLLLLYTGSQVYEGVQQFISVCMSWWEAEKTDSAFFFCPKILSVKKRRKKIFGIILSRRWKASIILSRVPYP